MGAGLPARAALLATLASEVNGVGIVAPDAGDPVISEVISRLRAELRLVGLEGQLLGCDDDGAQEARVCSQEATAGPPVDRAPAAPGAAPAGVASATIALGRQDDVVTLEVIEKLLNGSKFSRLVYVPARDGGDDPAVLAVRGVELLRDLHMDVERNRAAPAAAPEASPAAPSQEAARPWCISAMAGLLQGRDGMGPTVGPVLGLARAFGSRWAATLLASGPYFRDLGVTGGSSEYTSTRQELALLGVRGALWTGRLRPFGSVAAGALHLVADGHSEDATVLTHQRSLWSALLAGGVGAAVMVTRAVAVVGEADILAALPAGRITIRDQVVGTAGAPSALFQLGVWFSP